MLDKDTIARLKRMYESYGKDLEALFGHIESKIIEDMLSSDDKDEILAQKNTILELRAIISFIKNADELLGDDIKEAVASLSDQEDVL